MKTSKILSVLLSVLTALVVLTGSIAVPLLCRSFYYAHIGPMHLENYGLTEREIKTAYDEMMDFCLGKREDFSAERGSVRNRKFSGVFTSSRR